MKLNIISILVLCILCTSCLVDSSSTPKKKVKTEQKRKKSKNYAKASILTIEKTSIKKVKKPLQINDEMINITGWAFDDKNNVPASAVHVLLNKKAFSCKYGIPRKAIANKFGKKVLNSGFSCNIPVSKLNKGVYNVEVRVTGANGTTRKVSQPYPNLIRI